MKDVFEFDNMVSTRRKKCVDIEEVRVLLTPPIRNINTTRLRALWYFCICDLYFDSINDSRDQMIPHIELSRNVF